MSRERFDAALAEVKSVRWYPTVNDLIGGWLVSNVDKPASELNFEEGEIDVADFLEEDIARYIAELHNNRICMMNRVEDLSCKVHWLLEHGYTYGEDGAFCFPDGDIWHRP